jgi:hypothetical protein
MSINYPVIHEGYVPAYQASAVPYVTSSLISNGEIHEITFPQVTRFFNIQNIGSSVTDEIAIGFTANGLLPANGNYFTIGLPMVCFLRTGTISRLDRAFRLEMRYGRRSCLFHVLAVQTCATRSLQA